ARLGIGRDEPVDLQLSGRIDRAALPAPESWTIAGLASGAVRIGGTVAHPRATGDLRVEQATLQRPGLPAVTLEEGHVALERDVVRTEGITVAAEGGRLDVSGQAPLYALLPAAVAARLEVDPLAPFDLRARGVLDLASLPARNGWSASGLARVDATLAGAATRPAATGLLDVANTEVRRDGIVLASLAEGAVNL